MGKPKKDNDIIEIAKPHTIKKFELIERYVDKWARKILGYNGVEGQEGSKGIIYIDCMSNCGSYYDIDGNLIEGTAIRVAKRLNDIIAMYPGKECLVMFNDISRDKINRLQEEIEKMNLNNTTFRFECMDCNLFLRSLDINSFQKQYNTLLLYDPYQASIDWDAVTPFLNIWGEVIINHMVSDTNRGVTQVKKKDKSQKYQETYQKGIDEIIEIGNSKNNLNSIILDIIRNNTSRTRNKRYVSSFPFFTRTNGLIYNLIHVSGNIEGLKLFKKVAWQTFGDKSSLKDTHGTEMQLSIDFFETGITAPPTDQDCYFVHDIAKYIFEKYHEREDVTLEEVYADIDEHPIFPSDGYKQDIKTELKALGVIIPKSLTEKLVFPKSN